MKKIYAFTLDSDEYPSIRFRHNLRLIAFLLYDSIYNYDGEGFTALVINDNIRRNGIYTGHSDNDFYLEYNEYNEKYINYEPFLIGNKSFALTIDDEIMDENVVLGLMNNVLLQVSWLTKHEYKYTFNTVGYISKNKNDESNRKKAVHQLVNCVENKPIKNNVPVRKKVIDMSIMKRRIGLF